MSRVLLQQEPFIPFERLAEPEPLVWQVLGLGTWPASWIDHAQRPLNAPSVALFRLRFSLPEAVTVRVHVSADNRYRLVLDGTAVGRGPERGDPAHWCFESYDLHLAAGEHVLVAQTWWLHDQAPYAQMSVRPGFLFAAEGPLGEALSTGTGAWEAALMPSIAFTPAGLAWGTGARVRVDGAAYPWGWEDGAGVAWSAPVTIMAAYSARWSYEVPLYWQLTPSTLPPMAETVRTVGTLRYLTEATEAYPVQPALHRAQDAPAWSAWLAGQGTVTIPAHSVRRAIIDLENYFCAYPQLTVSGGAGARVRLSWAEGLFTDAEGTRKGHRDEITGKFFLGVGDEFLPDGGAARTFSTLWWEAGRYLELTVETGDAALTLDGLTLRETHYPLEMAGAFDCSDPRLAAVTPIMLRALQMCAHETYMDCPYYEQLMYIGDTRLEALTTYALTTDDRLPRKALTLFDHSRRSNGLTQSRFPSRLAQSIPPFALWWVCMVHDFALWRDEAAARALLPGVRGVMEAYRALLRPDNLLAAPPGWNFVDWVKEPLWPAGVPADAENGVSSILCLQCVLALRAKAALERTLGDSLLAERDEETALTLLTAVLQHFWREERGLIADDLAGTRFSEHAQCLALLSGLLSPMRAERVADGLLTAPDLARTTIYFAHYLFETYYALGHGDRVLERLGLWFALPEHGFKTTFEEPEPSRSDCHAWGAHPLFHYYATLLGIRPDALGFRRVRIAPQLGTLTWAEGAFPHPAGPIHVRIERGDTGMQVAITLPGDLTGVFVWEGSERALPTGTSKFTIHVARNR
ncbi:MAG TPA: alpha-L-rhamnosidase C-terminal domain-containing protein [Armatimonadota bacterium]